MNIELLEKAADWWVEQLSPSKFNWNNGAQNEGSLEDRRIGQEMWAFGNFTAITAREEITPEQIIIFKNTLIEKLKEAFEERKSKGWRLNVICSVDYHPGPYLYEAAQKAGIDTYAFPCKTVMWIDEKSVRTKLGYGAEDKLLIEIQ